MRNGFAFLARGSVGDCAPTAIMGRRGSAALPLIGRADLPVRPIIPSRETRDEPPLQIFQPAGSREFPVPCRSEILNAPHSWIPVKYRVGWWMSPSQAG